jgi:uncharacterized protein (TIGR04562 family)
VFLNNFDPQAFWSLIGGRPAIEATRLHLQSREEANAFLQAYGYDLNVQSDREKAWLIHSRAVTYLRTRILKPDEVLPNEVADPRELKDLTNLLLWASLRDVGGEGLQKWSCAVLRVMHVVAHLHNDLFSYFSAEIQDEIFKPYRNFVKNDINGIALVAADGETIKLKKFDMKPFKDSNSSITKLLAKPDEVAFGLLDKIGVRFVTESLIDVFRVMQFLVRNHVVSHPHVVPSQTNNTLYPVDLLLSVMETMPSKVELPAEEIDKMLRERLAAESDKAKYLFKQNMFTSKDYRFIKFINRQLVRVQLPDSGNGRHFTFFYPYEVQIIDSEHYALSLQGSASHDEYKARQRARARVRILGQA